MNLIKHEYVVEVGSDDDSNNDFNYHNLNDSPSNSAEKKRSYKSEH